MRRALTILMSTYLMLATATAADRVALVIGNGGYANAMKLPNAPHDAEDLSAALSAAGFEVITGIDLDHAAMQAKATKFAQSAQTATVVLFYYAGHSLAIGEQDVLIPVDAKLETAHDIEASGIGTGELIEAAMAKGQIAVILLDVARTNPYGKELRQWREQGSNAFQRQDVLVLHSTAPGELAADGEGRNSPFTVSLLKHLTEKGVDLDKAMNIVRKEVAESTGNRQLPWMSSSLSHEVYLGGK